MEVAYDAGAKGDSDMKCLTRGVVDWKTRWLSICILCLVGPVTWATQWGPLLSTQWRQGSPYNQYCPLQSPGGTVRCAVGCVAIATGQIAYDWGVPTSMAFDGDDEFLSEGKVGEREICVHIDDDAAEWGFPDFGALTSSLSVIQYNADSDEVAYFCFGIGIKHATDYG